MFGFLRELFGGRRKFAHYDDCPLIRYRIDREKLSDPVPLAKVPGIMKPIKGKKILARFVDETKWRPINYYRFLWERLPVGPATQSKLAAQHVEFSETDTEKRARTLLAQINDSKPPTATQRRTLAEFKIDPALAKTRNDAKALIATRREEKKAAAKAKREKEERAEAKKERELERLENAPLIAGMTSELEGFTASVNEFLPDWTPRIPRDIDRLEEYKDTVDDALAFAQSFDPADLALDVFSEMDSDIMYYVTFERPPTAEEIRNCRAELFKRYLRAGGDDFRQRPIFKRTLPSVVFER